MSRTAWMITTFLLLPAGALAGEDRHDASAAAYEHLATAIIEIRATEHRLVEGILNHHHGLAQSHLGMASQDDAVMHAKAAADEINAIANEGGKRVQAVRQKLLQAGHHHHTDAETQDDYIWIDSAEKKGLLDLARKIAQTTDAAALGGMADELSGLFMAAMQPE